MEQIAMDVYFQGIWRMDWGLGNPNKTAALIAVLMVAVWVLAYFRRWAFWVALPLFTALGICLVHTFSRGGVIAACAGLAFVAARAPRPWPWSRVGAILAAIWVMVAASIYLEASKRFAQGLIQEDRSITNRLEIWRAAPRMILDAPQGWGLGAAGKTYTEWYQPLDRSEEYRTLVNSHLTWLVEYGWLFRLSYLLGWGAILVLCWPSTGARWLAVPFGIWVCFAVGAFFSSVAESRWLWVAPGLSLLGVVCFRWLRKVWPPRSAWILPPALTTTVIAAIFLFGRSAGALPLHFERGVVTIGHGPPAFRVLASPSVLGHRPGRVLREHWLLGGAQTRGTVAIAATVADCARIAAPTTVAAGTLPSQDLTAVRHLLERSERLVLLNPAFFPQELGTERSPAPDRRIVFGEFCQSPSATSWRELIRDRVSLVEGAGDFLAQWPAIVFQAVD